MEITAKDRKGLYLSWIEDFLPELIKMQDTNPSSPTRGCLFYPYWQERENYCNARWQEAALTFSWSYQKFNKQEFKGRAVDGIDFWCKIQNRDGSFPECTKRGRSFAATAFSVYAVIEAISRIGGEERWLGPLERAGDWLCHNQELFFSNQQMAASLALLRIYEFTRDSRFLKNSQEKLKFVLDRQLKDGFFSEAKGRDLGYSSLTLQLLGCYYLSSPQERILDAARRYIQSAAAYIFPDGSFGGMYNSRHTGWLILDGFETFATFVEESKHILAKLLSCYNNGIGNIQHLPDRRHICTDLYRLCYAYDHANCDITVELQQHKNDTVNEGPIEISRKSRYIAITDRQRRRLYSLWTPQGIIFLTDNNRPKRKRYLNYLRRLGLYRFRKLRYAVRLMPLNNRRQYKLEDDGLRVMTKSRCGVLDLAYKRPYIIKKTDNCLQLKEGQKVIRIFTDAKVEFEDLGRISLGHTIFYGDKSLGFLRMKLYSSKGSCSYTIRFS